MISYLREGYEINFINYLGVVLDSLSSTLAGLQDLYYLPDENGWALLNPLTILSQVLPLSGFGFISDAQIAHEYSTIVLGSVSNGIALSSSGLLEASIISLHFNLFIYLAYLLIMISIIQKGLNSNYVIFNFFAGYDDWFLLFCSWRINFAICLCFKIVSNNNNCKSIDSTKK